MFTELSVAEDVVIRGEHIVVPGKLQNQVLDVCHGGHQGLVKSKQLLRSKVWFAGMDKAKKSKRRDACLVKLVLSRRLKGIHCR